MGQLPSNGKLWSLPIFAALKIFAFIFCVYILVLSAVPCCAVDECNEEIPQQSHAADTGGQDDNGWDNCSPFSQCGNCAGFTFQTGNGLLSATPALVQQKFTGYIQLYFPQYTASFWQPPRIV